MDKDLKYIFYINLLLKKLDKYSINKPVKIFNIIKKLEEYHNSLDEDIRKKYNYYVNDIKKSFTILNLTINNINLITNINLDKSFYNNISYKESENIDKINLYIKSITMNEILAYKNRLNLILYSINHLQI